MNYFRMNVSVKPSQRLTTVKQLYNCLLLSDCELISLTDNNFVIDVLTTLDASVLADSLALCFENFGDVSFSVEN